MKYFIYLYCIFFLTVIKAQNIPLDKIVAIVGSKIILQSEIEMQLANYKTQNANQLPPNAHCQLLEQLLVEKMLVTQAEVDSLEVSEDELEGELDNRIRYFVSLFEGDVAKLETYYKKSISEIKDDYRDEMKEQLLAKKEQQKIIANVKVTPSEIKKFFEAIPKDSIPYLNAEVEIGELIIKPKANKEKKEQIKTKLLELKQKIEKGEDFAKVASLYSEDPGSAKQGGDLGFTDRGQLVPEYEAAAFKLKNNQLSEIVESQFGFHLIQMLERRGDKIHTRHILMKPELSDIDANKAIQKLDSIRKLIVLDSISFKQAVEKFTEDEGSKKLSGMIINQQNSSTTFEIDQLDPSIYFAIDTLKSNQTSKPMEFVEQNGSKAYRILHVFNKTKPHQANLKDDYKKIQTIVEQTKQQEAILKWLNIHIPKTYIKLSSDFNNCENAQLWVRKKLE